MYDLPSEDPEESGLPDEFHDIQPQLLRETFCPPGHAPDRVFVATDLNLYYDLQHPGWHKRPDWFAVPGVDRLYQQRDLRLSYVIWQEKVAPLVVVELLSPGTEDEDLGQAPRGKRGPPSKWTVYEQILGIPYYFVYSRYTNELRVFALKGGRYRPIALSENRFWIGELGLGVGLWSGAYQGIQGLWMRWYDAEGWIATPEEQTAEARMRAAVAQTQTAEAQAQTAEAQMQAAEAQAQTAEVQMQAAEAQMQAAAAQAETAEVQMQAAEAEKRIQRLAAALRALGVDPDGL